MFLNKEDVCNVIKLLNHIQQDMFNSRLSVTCNALKNYNDVV